MMDQLEALSQPGIVPVVVLNRAKDAVPLVDALVQGGIRCVEITLRTSAAEAAIAAVADRTDVLVGAGTVASAEDVRRAAGAGARFLVSPGLTPEVASAAQREGLPLLPGVATASEVQLAREDGFTHLKLFPAAVVGGLRLIDALTGPFPDIHYMPSGGVTEALAPAYLGHPQVFAVAGSWMVPADALKRRDWDNVVRLSSQTVARLAEH